ncbi:MAG: SAM hydrolase/SAM-dependent halogenase family protein [Acidimicrobiia bacterium]
MAQPISFLSDFGTQDEFVGVVHGVIYRLSPDSRVIDITHGIAPGDIRGGALALTRAVQFLPPGVVLAIVDPGVGTARKALALETGAGFFVGPDNGLLSPAVAMVGGAGAIHAIENPELIIEGPGATFAGRDVLAPAAALLAAGEATLADLGPALDPGQVLPLMLPLSKVEESAIYGEVLWVDWYGNVQTNVGPEEMAVIGVAPGEPVEVRVGASTHEGRFVTAFGDVGAGELAIHVDSAGLIAIAVRGGRADEELSLAAGRPLTLRRS